MKTTLFLIIILALISCSKQEQSDILPFQTIQISIPVGDFNIPTFKTLMSNPISVLGMNGTVYTDKSPVLLLLKTKSSNDLDSIVLSKGYFNQNLDIKYLMNDDNSLIGRLNASPGTIIQLKLTIVYKN